MNYYYRRLPATFDYNSNAGVWDKTPAPHSYLGINGVKFQPAAGSSAQNEPNALTQLSVDHRGARIGSMVGGSILFRFNGREYRDEQGSLFTGPMSAPIDSGTYEPLAYEGLITEWDAGARSVISRAALTVYGRWPLREVLWRTPGAPVRVGSFQVVDGKGNSAQSDNDGDMAGADPYITGRIDYDTGVYTLEFAAPYPAPEQVRYNAVVLKYLPLDPALLGLNPVRLPLDGRVPIVQPGNMLVIHDTDSFTLPNPAVAGQTYALPRGLLAYVEVRDALGLRVPTDRYTINLVTGSITMANPLDLSEYDQPLKAEHRIEDMVLCVDAQLSGDIQISGAIVHAYGTDAYISSALRFGDLQSRVTDPFDQQAWTGVWSDERIGSDATAEFNHTVYPVTVTNLGAITERFRIEFTSTNAFRLIGETTGVHPTTGTIGLNYAPNNPAAGAPYFTVPALGWGSGWVAGNQVRFNTFAAAAPMWINRTTLQGPAEDPTDDVRLEFRGDSQ